MNNDASLYINGEWVAASGPTFQSTNPADESVVWHGRAAEGDDVREATLAARRAFPAWSLSPLEQRIEAVRRFGALVKQGGDELALVISREVGKPFWESKTEVAAVVGKVELAIEALRERRDTTRIPLGDQTAVTRYMPVGVAAVLGPFNFPAHLPNGHIVPALLAGNTVVFKPSEVAPAVGAWLVNAWHDSGLPAGVVNLVQGGRSTGQALSQDPELDGLFFTGSSAAGRALHRQFGEWPQKILALEMGGNNPLVVYRTGNPAAAAYHTVLSAFLTAGQRCTCARRLIVVADERTDRFIEQLIGWMGRLRVGFHTDSPEPFMGPVISAEQGDRLLAAQAEMAAVGGRPLVSMQPLRNCRALLSPGLIDMTDVQRPTDQEHFGPLLQLYRAADIDAAIATANATSYGLAAGLLSDEADAFEYFVARIRAGVVNWNRQTTGASGKLPFGGCGLSGNYRPSGYFAADYCAYPIASLQAESLDLPATLMTGIDPGA